MLIKELGVQYILNSNNYFIDEDFINHLEISKKGFEAYYERFGHFINVLIQDETGRRQIFDKDGTFPCYEGSEKYVNFGYEPTGLFYGSRNSWRKSGDVLMVMTKIKVKNVFNFINYFENEREIPELEVFNYE